MKICRKTWNSGFVLRFSDATLAITLIILGFTVPAAEAAITTFTNRAAWENAVNNNFEEEFFTDSTLNPGVSVVSSAGHISGGVWSDRLNGSDTTTFIFAEAIIGFGGNWNLAPAGAGTGIRIYFDGVFIGSEIPDSYTGQFFGAVSDVPFNEVLLTEGTQSGVAETFYLDNMVYSWYGIYYVDDNAPNDPVPGIPGQFIGDANFSDPDEDGSPDHPFDSIQKAIQKETADEANNARIIVLDGTYTGIGNYDIDPNGLAMKIKSQNGPKSCIIDCQGQARAFIFQSGENNNTVVSGLKITHGNSTEHAGAIYCQNSSPTIEDCIITRNYAAWSGGAILLDDSNAVISQCRITYNKCEASGAAICSITGSPTVINSLIAYNDGYFSGAASSVYGSNITFINCTIADNSAAHEIGTGGVYCWDGNSVITNSILWGNLSYYNNQIELFYGDETAVVTYSNIQMTSSTWPGTGNINAEPLFAGTKWLDYHLKSTAGCWNPILQTDGDFNDDGIIDNFDYAVFAMFWLDAGPAIPADLDPDDSVNLKDVKVFTTNWLKTGINTGGWVTDDVNSPCIDAGDPNSALPLEPGPNGGIINIGAYGNTEHASKSP